MVAEVLHPILLVNVTVAVPVVTPVTNPELLTVNIDGSEETQGIELDAVAEPVS